MVPAELKLGSRGSQLARTQVVETLALLTPLLPAGTRFTETYFDTPGDRDKQTPLTSPDIPDDYFTRDLDDALRNGELDLTIHSAKDLPEVLADDLCLAALLPAKDIRDALVFPRDWPTDKAPGIIGTSSPRRAALVLEQYPDATTRSIRGDVPGRIEQVDRGDYDAIIVAACALDRLGLSDRIGTYLACDPAPQQGRLALVTRTDDADLVATLRTLDVRRNAGLVALVGCPADPSMIPSRVRRYLEAADIVLHDRLVPEEILQTVLDRCVYVGKAGGNHSMPQSEINRRMLNEAEQGKLVVRLQGGDPGIFGHLGEELQFLTDWNIRVDVVPALSAAQVAAARAHAPLTHRDRGRNISFVSGHPAKGRAPDPLPGPDEGNLAIYMGVGNRGDIHDRLREAGWPAEAPVIIGERIGYEDEGSIRIPLQSLPSTDVRAPAVILVGSHPSGSTPTTLFTGTNPEHFLKHGPLIHCPMIELVAEPIDTRTQALRENLDDIHGILFPSRYAVKTLAEALLQDRDVRALAGKKLLAVGPATARALQAVGLRADLAAASLGGVRDLAEHITDDLKGRYLYPCSDAAPRERRVAYLADYGVELIPSIFYRNQETAERPLPRLPFARVLFTSSSTAHTYFKRYPDELSAPRTWIAVGPSTLETLHTLGLPAELL